LRELREQEARRAVKILGLPPERIHFLGFRDTAAPKSGIAFASAVNAMVRLIREYNCRILCTPWLHEPHSDHEAAHIIARSAARMAKARLLSYLIWGWTLTIDAALPDSQVDGWRLDISKQLSDKRRAIAAHLSQFTDLISDDPRGFQLPSDLLSAITNWPYEVYLDQHE